MANHNPGLHLENLRPWKPGQSGNPGGRPSRSKRITEALIAQIEERDADRALAKVWLDLAIGGDPVFFRELLNRIEGQPEKGDATGPVEVIVRRADRGLALPPPPESGSDPE